MTPAIRRLVAGCAGIAAGLALTAPAQAAGTPAVAAARGNAVVVLDAAGGLVHRFAPFTRYSLAGRLFAGSGATGDTVVARDAITGRKRFTVANAFAPVVLGPGRVAFLPDHAGRRDPQANSVWLRDRGGKIRKLVQFSNGPGLPGVETGQPDAGTILSFSFDAGGTTLAVAEGNDVDLFFYDIWLVDVASGEAFRATTGDRSRFPTLSPDGERLAYLREEEHCGGPEPGYRAGDVAVQATGEGASAVTLLDGSCTVFYTEPAWLSDTELVAVRLTRTAPGAYRNDLVLVAADTAAVSVLAAPGDVFALSASASRRLVGYMRFTTGGSVLYDVDARSSRVLPSALGPRLTGARAF
ncbi:MAG: hypothetical protein IT201_00790 [Thermoleophilia bacterium]|nr:hypothetical protein [Thermoleophilia bacterium]